MTNNLIDKFFVTVHMIKISTESKNWVTIWSCPSLKMYDKICYQLNGFLCSDNLHLDEYVEKLVPCIAHPSSFYVFNFLVRGLVKGFWSINYNIGIWNYDRDYLTILYYSKFEANKLLIVFDHNEFLSKLLYLLPSLTYRLFFKTSFSWCMNYHEKEMEIVDFFLLYLFVNFQFFQWSTFLLSMNYTISTYS